MRPIGMTSALVAAAWMCLPTPVQALIGCEVLAVEDGTVALYAAPDQNAEIVTVIPYMHVVSMLDAADVAAAVAWEYVAHNPTQGSMLSVDDLFGWVQKAALSDECG